MMERHILLSEGFEQAVRNFGGAVDSLARYMDQSYNLHQLEYLVSRFEASVNKLAELQEQSLANKNQPST